MKLFLSSYQDSGHGKGLLELLNGETKIGVITNAKDYKAADERQDRVVSLLDRLREIGLQPEELDLRPYFGKPEQAAHELATYRAIWLAGGNSFVLRRALEYTNLMRPIADAAQADKLVYAGDSAGACLATPTLNGIEFADDPTIVPDGYSQETFWDGLSLVDFSLIPHYGDENLMLELGRVEGYYQENQLPYKTISNQQTIVVDGDRQELLS